MIALAALAYFVLSVLLGALLLLPDFRSRCWQLLRAGWQWLAQGTGQVVKASGSGVAGAAQQGSQQAGAAARFAHRHRKLLLACLLLLGTGPLAVYLLRDQVQLEGYAEDYRPPNPQIAALLAGEQLVAPAPLPPEVFSAAEAEVVRPLLASADRKWDLMDPEFVQRLLVVFKLMREQYGYEMALLEGYRSPERQNLLAGMGGSVTNARAFQSWHQYGLAADAAFYRNGKLVISEKDPWAMRGYQLFGQTAQSLGLVWGGNWKLMDLGHVELRRKGVMKR